VEGTAREPKLKPKVELVAHEPAWARAAFVEAQRLATVFGNNHGDIQHIGSTAIAGIKAKPTIDLLPRVHSLGVLDGQADAVRALGYRWRGEFGIAGRRLFTRDDPATEQRLFNVHAFEYGAAEIDRHLAFRDYLRAHAHEARMYEQEKETAAKLHPNDVLAYNAAKSAWIKACEARALAWWRPSGR
jgi:GrpB-like predicted nucleotidyltransferase (UPF0157 family)